MEELLQDNTNYNDGGMDVSSNLSDEQSSGGSKSTTNREGSSVQEQENLLGHKETRAVNRSKFLVYLALLLAAAGIGTATYFIARRGESDGFESDVRDQKCLMQ